MKKKLTALITVLTISASIMPFASAATLKEELAQKAQAINALVPGKYEITSEGSIVSPVIEVPTDIEVKENGAATYRQNVSVTYDVETMTRKFDFRATMFMQPVAEAFDKYMTMARQFVSDANRSELDNLDVTGQFTIKVKYPASYFVIPAAASTDTGMAGFVSDNGIYEETVARTVDNNTLTVTVDLKDGITASILEDNVVTAFADLVFGYDGVEVQKTGTYVIEGEVTGQINVGTDTIVIAPFKAIQSTTVIGDTSAPGKIQATVDASIGETNIGPTDPTVKKVTYTLNNGKKDYFKDTVTLPDGGYVVDFNTIAVPEPEPNMIFKGWYLDKECTQKANEKETIKKNTTFYAGWIDLRYNVKFVVDGVMASVNTQETGSVQVGEQQIEELPEGAKLDVSGITVKDKKISGWFLDPECTKPVDDTVVITEDTILYAKTSGMVVPPILDDGGDTGEHYAYIIGYPEGDVRPLQSITRGEVATIFFRLLTEESRTANATTENSFTDVDSEKWSNNAISTMAAMDIVTGYEESDFRPENPITRAEFAAIAARFSDDDSETKVVFTDVDDSHWAKQYIDEATALQWITGYEDSTFRPENNITRAEVMTIVNRMLKRRVTSEYIHADAVKWTDNPADAWYYEEVIEATNSHKFERLSKEQLEERWTQMLPNRDWAALEK